MFNDIKQLMSNKMKQKNKTLRTFPAENKWVALNEQNKSVPIQSLQNPRPSAWLLILTLDRRVHFEDSVSSKRLSVSLIWSPKGTY